MSQELDAVLKDFEGNEVLGPNGEPTTLRSLVLHAVLNPGKPLSEGELLELFSLGKAVAEREALSPEQKKIVREACTRLYTPLAFGRICEALSAQESS